ncbi:hypothetical protein ACIPPM_13720 [Streptomyces sp. NPDC090119]|uniref:hypothetical protein n=1 Tax=Streptomyces sp. NPDC090119 TaxID=3365951 RepID=UPI003803D760
MSADEARGQNAATTPEQERTGPRHAAQRKPLMTRLHMPAGKAIAMAAMPTAVLMGMGFTPTLAVARDQPPNAKMADEYKDCVAALDGDKATPSASASESEDAKDDNAKDDGAKGEESKGSTGGDSKDGDSKGDGGTTPPSSSAASSAPSSSDSGSDDKAAPEPASSKPAAASSAEPSADADAKEAGGGLLGTIGDTIGDVLTGGKKSATPSASSTPSAPAPSASASSASPAPSASATAGEKEKPAAEPAAKPGAKAAETPEPGASQGAEKATESPEAPASASATPSPSASASDDAADCEKATDAVGGVDNKVLLPDDPWFLNASSLWLKGADYKGIVEVRTSSGKTKKVLKYVISGGTEIGDLHQTVKDKASGKTYHVQAGKGTTSTITGGQTVMYTESISGKLLGLIPLTFSPDSPPPLNLPQIYFTDVTVRQAGQFGGTLTVPHLHQYID